MVAYTVLQLDNQVVIIFSKNNDEQKEDSGHCSDGNNIPSNSKPFMGVLQNKC